MGSQAPQRGVRARRALWSALPIFKVAAVLLILHVTCGTYHMSSAKELSNADYTIDDTFDIDQFDETPAVSVAAAANSNVALARSKRNLDTESLLEDELQPFAAVDNTDADSSSWLLQGVKRVRRGLSRLFGKEEDATAATKQSHHRRNHSAGIAKQHNSNHKHNKHPKHKTQSLDGKKQRSKHQTHNKHRSNLLLQRHKAQEDVEENGAEHASKQLKKLAKKHTKRQSDFEGSGVGDGDEVFEEPSITLWRTKFVINEPWSEVLADSKSVEFLELHRQLEIAFRDLFHETHNDEDFDIAATLETVERSNDNFKIYVTVQLELPAEVNDFGQDFVNHINSFHRLGNLGVEVGDRYYFRNARDAEGIDYEEDNRIGADEEQEVGVEGDNKIPDNTPNYEYDCDRNPDGEFQCTDNSLVSCSDVCNRYPDCADNSDEDIVRCQPIYDEEDRQEQRAEEEQRRLEEEEAEARRRAEEEDKVLQLAQREEEERQRAYEAAEEERRRHEQEIEEERPPVETDADDNPVTSQPNEDDYDEWLRAEEEKERQRDRAEYERQIAAQRAEERRRAEEAERQRAAQEAEERRRAEEAERQRAAQEAEERRRAEYDRGREPYEQPNESETPIQPAQPDVTEKPEFGYEEGSGESYNGISTDRSTIFTQSSGCRGDTSFTCPQSGVQICDEQRCDGREDCPDGEDEYSCPGEGNEGGYDLGEGYEKVCAENEFKCDERCLPREFICNGARECIDGSDEANCPTQAPRGKRNYSSCVL